ncbi:MAG: hypothetical protein WAM66_15105 [Acidobacteriaceae bacterium]
MNRGLLLAIIAALFLPLTPAQEKPSAKEMARAAAAQQKERQSSIQINQLAGDIRSLSDSRAFVNAVAKEFADELPPQWTTAGLRGHIAEAEYQTATNPAKLIPEQRVADAWNRFVNEIGAPSEALVTVAEIHNLRDADYTSAQVAWARGLKEIWTVPNIYAIGPDGKVANGCRAVEALRIEWEMANQYENLLSTRYRVQHRILLSDVFKKQEKKPARGYVKGEVTFSSRSEDPVEAAEQRYISEHGIADFSLLVEEMIGTLLG